MSEWQEGAISRLDDDATAVGHRKAPYLHGIFAVWTEPEEREEQIGWVRGFWEALQPWSDGGGYLNYIGEDEGDERVVGSFGEAKYRRLVELKRKWDPTNFFAGAQNIRP